MTSIISQSGVVISKNVLIDVRSRSYLREGIVAVIAAAFVILASIHWQYRWLSPSSYIVCLLPSRLGSTEGMQSTASIMLPISISGFLRGFVY